MPRWIEQRLRINDHAQIDLMEDQVWVGSADDPEETSGCEAQFKPDTRDDANRMSIALKMAAKRLEDIGKGLP